MSNDIPVKLSDELSVGGSGPIILIGPNGSGKTRLGVKMARLNRADMVAALRNIALPSEITVRFLTYVTQELRDALSGHLSEPWQMSREISQLFGKLMVENADSAVRFRDGYAAGKHVTPEATKLTQLQLSWTRLFPGRQIHFDGYRPTVVSEFSHTPSGYAAQQMSDGERVALYLAGRVLDTAPLS